MIYSVWNKATRAYSVYDGDSSPIGGAIGTTPLGSVPSESIGTLPPKSRYLGESESAQGIIVKEEMTFSQFFYFVSSIIVARFAYDFLNKIIKG